MTFVADESIDRPQPRLQRPLDRGSRSRIADEDVLNRARSGQSVLLTADKDFGEPVYRQQRLHTGIVLLRLAGLAPAAATLPHSRGSVTAWNHEVTFVSRAREQAVRPGPAQDALWLIRVFNEHHRTRQF